MGFNLSCGCGSTSVEVYKSEGLQLNAACQQHDQELLVQVYYKTSVV
jgi:hypothetical protein